MDRPHRTDPHGRGAVTAFFTAALLVTVLLLLLPGVRAAAEERHSVLLNCSAEGFAGRKTRSAMSEVVLEPGQASARDAGRVWTLDELRQLPGFRLECAALRFTVTSVQGIALKYALICGNSRSELVSVRAGRNLWDVTKPLSVWLESPEKKVSIVPAYQQSPWGMRIGSGSVSLQVTFTTTEDLPDFRLDRVQFDTLYEVSLNMLEQGNTFLAHYDETADSLLEPMLPLGVPYYYAGGTEEKFLRRFIPSTTTAYYQDTHMYLCGLDCAGMTHLIFEKRGLERHPSISDLLHAGVGRSALKKNDPDRWPMLLLPGELIAVKHGTFHIMMYLGTMRQFGWKESNAGEAASLLDAPLVIHCGGNPFYYERYQQYIKDMGYRNTYPPDGGVTVSVIQRTDKNAPHSTDTSWGKHFGWYTVDGQPLLVFRLEDCTDMAWYGPEQ